jgi:hypothetical protein
VEVIGRQRLLDRLAVGAGLVGRQGGGGNGHRDSLAS